jgi:hypothetical protein
MSLAERDIGIIALPSGNRSLADLRFEEFSVSPVDEVIRALAARNIARPSRGDQVVVERLIHTQVPKVASADFFALRVIADIRRDWDKWADDFPSSEPSVNQLQLEGDFSPSKRLTEIWITGLLELGKEAGRATVAAADFESAQEFSRTLSTALGTLGQQLRFQKGANLAITKAGKFTPSYQIYLCDAFLIIPDQAAEFLELLSSEILMGIQTGCRIAGSWGEIVASASRQDLLYSLAAPEFETDPTFEESEEIE